MTIKEISQNDVKGLVLVGGASTRMGEHKAHLNVDGKFQWQRAQDALNGSIKDIYFSVSQKLNKPLPVSENKIIHDVFSEPCGPLGGIISAFKKFPSSAFFVLACDMPYFDDKACAWLLERRNNTKLASIFEHQNGLLEPLCGIYEPALCEVLLKAWKNDQLCARKLLDSLEIERVKALDEQWLININHKYELNELSSKKADSTELKTIHVHYYASLREQAKCEDEQINSEASTLIDLYYELKRIYSFKDDPSILRFAKNDRLVAADELLEDKDRVVFLPPVSGG